MIRFTCKSCGIQFISDDLDDYNSFAILGVKLPGHSEKEHNLNVHDILKVWDEYYKVEGLLYTAIFKAGLNTFCLLHQCSLGEYDRRQVLHCDHVRFHFQYLKYRLQYCQLQDNISHL